MEDEHPGLRRAPRMTSPKSGRAMGRSPRPPEPSPDRSTHHGSAVELGPRRQAVPERQTRSEYENVPQRQDLLTEADDAGRHHQWRSSTGTGSEIAPTKLPSAARLTNPSSAQPPSR